MLAVTGCGGSESGDPNGGECYMQPGTWVIHNKVTQTDCPDEMITRERDTELLVGEEEKCGSANDEQVEQTDPQTGCKIRCNGSGISTATTINGTTRCAVVDCPQSDFTCFWTIEQTGKPKAAT
jgi:hypothetical protein